MKLAKILAVLLIAFALAAPMASAAPTPTPADQAPTDQAASKVVKNFYAALTSTMKEGDRLGYAGRYRKLDPAIRAAYNLPLMTRFAVGPDWLKATPEEQKQLVSAFSDFSIATYASRFTKYDGEKFEVLDQKPAAGGGVIVETRLTPGTDAPVKLDYLMRQDDSGTWRIVDVFLDGSISELATRRSEFTSIVEHDGIPALVNQLGEKSKQMGPS